MKRETSTLPIGRKRAFNRSSCHDYPYIADARQNEQAERKRAWRIWWERWVILLVAPVRTQKGREEEEWHLEVLRTKNKSVEVNGSGIRTARQRAF